MHECVPVLFVDTSPAPTRGGAQQSLLFILRNLSRDRFAPSVLAYVPHGIEDELRELGIPLHILDPKAESGTPAHSTPASEKKLDEPEYPYHGTWRDLGARIKHLIRVGIPQSKRIANYARETGARIIYLNGSFPSALSAILAARRLGIPCIAHQRRISTYTLLDRLFARAIDLMIFYSSHYMDLMLSIGIAPRYRTVIYNSVNRASLPGPPELDKDEYRNEFGCVEEIPIACHVGTLVPVNGQDLVIQAAQRAWRPERPFYLLFIGDTRDSGYHAHIRSLYEGKPIEPYVVFAGYRQDALSILNVCDISLEATQVQAGFSRVVIESLALGKKLVAPRNGCQEILQDGINGYLYKDGDPDDFGTKIAEALDTDGQSIIEAARETSQTLFDENAVMQQLERVLDGVLRGFSTDESEGASDAIRVVDRLGRACRVRRVCRAK